MDISKLETLVVDAISRAAVMAKNNVAETTPVLFEPDMTELDTPKEYGCSAFRVKMTASKVSENAYRRFLDSSNLKETEGREIGDLDGDKKPELLFEYEPAIVKILQPSSDIYCKQGGWDLLETSSKSFLYFVKFSTGGYVGVEALAQMISAKKD